MTDRVLEAGAPARGGSGRLRIDSDALRMFAVDAVRYFGVSVAALAVDYGLLVVLHRACDLHYLAAATISFVAGLAVAWLLSAVFVFRGRRHLSPWREFLGFALTGVAGLLLTQGAMAALVGGLGFPPELAKLPVAGVVFTFNFLSRRFLLFTAPPSPGTVSAATAD